jgi:hypothetical protein
MAFIEAPTTFYLGRKFDPATRRMTEDVVYYDSRDLTTHAVVVGMTGSGKTGLCITLLEEAILDNIPAIIIDPKGDITNLLLAFPDMTPDEFAPWINVDDARRAGMDVATYAADTAARWKDGLASWSIVPDRVRWLKKAARYSIYTPGSDAGLPISILASLRAPRDGWAGNEEAHREKINGIVTALLALIGLSVEPIKDPEHVLVANIFEYAWRQGRDLTLEDIIIQVQKPPFEKLGVFPIDQYIDEKKRVKLAMGLNNIVAAPSFQSWVNGEPMDIQHLLYQPNGRPRVSIFYTAHLSEAERMFITTLLLENLLGWMRTLSGTTSLRALMYIDEMFGYFPPYPKNPPTKEPIMRLLKQARAFGIGMILATQNPGDLDYKGLANAGTWFIGRLQSDNDRAKVMEGLNELANADDRVSVKEIAQLIADIEPRVFLMRNVHDDAGPTLIHTRWSMSYLRGPLTRQQVQALMATQKQQLMVQLNQAPQMQAIGAAGYTQPVQTFGAQTAAAYPPTLPSIPGADVGFAAPSSPPTLPGMQQGFSGQTVPVNQANLQRPQDTNMTTRAPGANLPAGYVDRQPPLPSSITQYFLPVGMNAQQAITQWEQQTRFRAQGLAGLLLAYQPVLLAQAIVRYQDRKANVYTARTYAFHVPNLDRAGLVHWEQYQAQPVEARRISQQPEGTAIFGDVAPGLADPKRMSSLKSELTDMLYNTAVLVIPYNPTLKIFGSPDTDFSVYQAQVQQAAREKRDAEIDVVTKKYGAQAAKLEEQIRRKDLELQAEKKELQDRKREELFTTGEALLSLMKGRTTYTLSRMSQATRYRRQTNEDLQESRQFLTEAERQIQDLETEFQTMLQQTNDNWARVAAQAEEYRISALKKDIQVELFGVGWLPSWFGNINGQQVFLPAFTG